MTVLETQGLAARHAARALAVAGTARKNAALEAAARTIEARQGEILAANAADLEAAMAAGLRPALLDRLALDEGRIAGIVEGVRQVAALPDPIGAVTKMDTRPNGLTIGKRRVPLGVIGIIYEARPNVTVDAAALCLKSGNAALLRGGKEAFRSNQAFVAVLRDALEEAGLPRDCVALVADATSTSTRGPTWTWQPASSTTPRPPAPRCATPPSACWWTGQWRGTSCPWRGSCSKPRAWS